MSELRPVEPMYCLRPRILTATAQRFVSRFPGDVLYAVKCNAEPAVLRSLWRGGVRHFDCASPGEIRLVRQMFPDAHIHYMHPIKSPSFIREAYFEHGVRDFSLDSAEEIEKILAATEGAADLGLYIRMAVPKGQTAYDLSGKFGAAPELAAELLRQARPVAARLGLCFHVGSQCLDPAVYERTLDLAGTVIAAAGVPVDGIDVGGGFPVSYPEQKPPDLAQFFAAIERGFARLGLPNARLWCEPGRAMVAAGASLVVQIVARRGDVLHINDGVYGNLSDAGYPKWRFPARLVRPGAAVPKDGLKPFSFYGPTCDSADYMCGPFLLPEDAAPGDWIELGQLGAYGTCLRTGFNGFERTLIVDVADQPLLATAGHLDHVRVRRAA
ncbi:MAG TPA: type III PLP-dependent enzyme [Aliidongia sp.]|nr:type III PLP-dependent enzyme [Aliidongia sp.]